MVKVDLPEPETPVMQVKVPSGMLAVTFCRLLERAPLTVSFLPLPLRRLGRHRDAAAAGQIVGGDAAGRVEHVLQRAGGDHAAAVDAGAGPHVDDVIGGADRVLVMLDDEHGVAEVAQALEGDQQPVVVALVEADRRFVEDVEDAGQAGADLGGEADALALAARQGAGFAVEGQVFQPDVVEEAEALDDLLQDALADLAFLGRQLVGEAGGPGEGLADRAADGVGDGLAGDLDAQRLGLEAGAVADLAGGGGLVAATAPRASRRISVARKRLSRLAMTPSNGLVTS